MIRLKAKNDAEKADSSGNPEQVHSIGHPESSEMNSSGTDASGVGKSSGESSKAGEGGVKLLGIGGRRAKKSGKATVTKTPGEIRIQKDVTELDGGEIASITFPNPNNLCQFKVKVSPDCGIWKGASYDFDFTIPPLYPHDPPRVVCCTKVYHPNINLTGNVCLNILREDWKPVLDINSIIYGLIYLFYEPNSDDPLNHEAADLFRRDRAAFEYKVRRTLRGGFIDGEQFKRLV